MDMALHGLAGYCTKRQSPNNLAPPQARSPHVTHLGETGWRGRSHNQAMRMNEPLHKTRISKRLAPDQDGAKKLARRFGGALVCVRYRQDPALGLRYTTVELLVEQAQLPTARARNTVAFVHIRHIDRAGKTQALAEGATWDAKKQAWRMSLESAQRLGLADAVLEKHPPMDIKNGQF
jgi:hypothetical protein